LAGRERIREVPTQTATDAGITTASNIATKNSFPVRVGGLDFGLLTAADCYQTAYADKRFSAPR
jgi:hypothetical protein